MRSIRLLILLSLIAISVAYASQQVILKLGSNTGQGATKPKVRIISTVPRTKNGQYGLADIVMLDNGESWGAGYDNEHNNRLFRSRDGGKIWEPIEIQSNGQAPTKVMFADRQYGWAVGGNGLILRTSDGGNKWTSLRSLIESDLQIVSFFNADVGYVAGSQQVGDKLSDEVTGNVIIYCTGDGGIKWRQCYDEDEPSSVFQVLALSETEAFAIFDGTRLMRTENRGTDWQNVVLSINYPSYITFSTDSVGWVVGSHGLFQASSDRGRSWHEVNSLPLNFSKHDWNAIAFNDDGIGLAVAEDSSIALTTDNGETWEMLEIIKSDPLRVLRISGTHASILGANNVYSIDLSEATVKSR